MERMALPISFQNQNRNLLGSLGSKLRLEDCTYSLSGVVVDWSQRDIMGVEITFIDRQSNIEICHVWTDASGRFQAVVTRNAAGYRVAPRKTDWGFTPGFFDVADPTDAIWFHAKYYGKGDTKDDGSK